MKITPKDFFLHVGVMVALYVSAISLMTLLFQIINVLHPDVLAGMNYSSSYDPYSAGIRWAIASLIIVFPLFVFLSWLLDRGYNVDPLKRDVWIRRWLTFLTLFAAGIAIATDLIILINSFLGGEITTRFVLKVLVVLVVTGFVFGYYLWDLRRSMAIQTKKPKVFAILAGLVILASLIGGFLIMGSPITQRNLRLDEQKVLDLQNIQAEIISFWQYKNKLPSQLSDLSNSTSSFYIPKDPQSGGDYDYRVVSGLSFELCTNFNLETSDVVDPTMPQRIDLYGDKTNDNWKHGPGHVCFERTIDPEFYVPFNKSGIKPDL